jgi:hypothetical protein
VIQVTKMERINERRGIGTSSLKERDSARPWSARGEQTLRLREGAPGRRFDVANGRKGAKDRRDADRLVAGVEPFRQV